MKALSSSSFISSQFTPVTNKPRTTPFLAPINISYSSIPPKKRSSLSKISSSTSTISTDLNPKFDSSELEEKNGEKFDWFSHWYPVAAVCDLDKRVPHARRIIGKDIVIWWDRNKDAWQVFDDSCPHRLAPLSEGRIDQWGRLQCVYHGWCFDGAGDCKFIPQAPADGPPVHTFKKACVASYPCTVQNKIVWFWPRSEPEYKDIATKKMPPYIPELDDPSYTSLLMSRDIPYGYEVLIENLMDPAHVPYAHYGILTPSRKPRDKGDREGGMPLEINVTELDKNGFSAKQDGGGFNKFVAPCLFSYFSKPVSDDESSTSGKKLNKRILLLFFCIPVSPGKSRVLFSFPRNFAVWVDRVIPRWILHIRSNLVLDSDLYLLHLEERKIHDIGVSNWQKACFVPTKSDATIIAFRKWLKKYSDGQINWAPKFSTELPPTPPKEQLMDRYWSHVVNCSSCSKAVDRLKIFEVVLQVMSIALVGVVAIRQSALSVAVKTSWVALAVFCFAVSKWLSHFIYKTFYFYDYNHALV
ncbi:hypothetical protein ACHQM5_019323 [Ranunculus cassubicifolius]